MNTTCHATFDVSGFTYDPATGWIVKGNRRRDYSGGRYRFVFRERVCVLAHLVAWRLYYGDWPPAEKDIDHVNRDKHDNRICNLRIATRSQNGANEAPKKSCKSGERGVYWNNYHCKWTIALRSHPVVFSAYASHKISAIVAARLIRRILHGEFGVAQEAA